MNDNEIEVITRCEIASRIYCSPRSLILGGSQIPLLSNFPTPLMRHLSIVFSPQYVSLREGENRREGRNREYEIIAKNIYHVLVKIYHALINSSICT